MPSPLGEGGPAGPDEGRVYCGTPIADGTARLPLIRQRSGPLTASPSGEAMHTQSTNDP